MSFADADAAGDTDTMMETARKLTDPNNVSNAGKQGTTEKNARTMTNALFVTQRDM